MASKYTKDEKRVYFENKAIPYSDPETFVEVCDVMPTVCYFAYDKNQFYADGGSREGVQILEDIEITSLEFFEEKSFFADRFHLFYFNGYFIQYCSTEKYLEFKEMLQRRKPNVDAWWNRDKTFYQALTPLSADYYTDGKRILYLFDKEKVDAKLRNYNYPYPFDMGQSENYFSEIPHADAVTFTVLNEYYACDKNHMYHTFRAIAPYDDTFKIINGHFAKDEHTVWYGGYPCKDPIDPDSFELIGYRSDSSYHFAKDKNALFSVRFSTRIGKYKGYSALLVQLKNGDSGTFEIINDIWAKDKNNVYRYAKIWGKIHAPSFEFLFTDSELSSRSYGKDKNHLYDANGEKVVKGIDGNSFVMLNEYWGKDKNVVYNFKSERIMKSLDAESFKIMGNNGEAEDQNYIFTYVPALYKGIDLGYKELKKTKKSSS